MKLSRKTAIAIKGLVNPPRRIGSSLIARPGITSQSGGGAIPVKIGLGGSGTHGYAVYRGSVVDGEITWATSTEPAYCVGHWLFGEGDITTAVDGPAGLLLDAPDGHRYAYGHLNTEFTTTAENPSPVGRTMTLGQYSPEHGFDTDSTLGTCTWQFVQRWPYELQKSGPILIAQSFLPGTEFHTDHIFRMRYDVSVPAWYVADRLRVSYIRFEGTPGSARNVYDFTYFSTYSSIVSL